jgi:predicted phage baseplate assembly protein
VLSMEYQCRDAAGLFGVDRQSTAGARLAIGVLAAPPAGGMAADTPGHNFRSPLKATLVINNKREVVSIVSDTTQGLLTTGTILLNLDNIKDSPQRFAIELSAPGGFARPPRIFQIEPNVIPIQQVRQITRELQQPTGMPDWTFTLDEQGLSFATGKEPITLEVADSSGVARWSPCESLSESGPDDLQYELNAETGRVTFGNGINGRIPPFGSQVLVSYAVSDAGVGDVARNRKWTVAGFEGAFGVNPDPVTGGAPPPGGEEQRRMARQRSREEHALVTADDITVAAKALPLLEVARAWLVTPNGQTPQTGVLTLVALRSRQNGAEPAQIPETARWLQAIRRSLTSRMPLGTWLAVVAPRYKDFSILATLEAYPRLAPQAVEKAAMNELRRRFALDGRGQDAKPRQPGVPVTKRHLSAWLRAIDGVKRVVALKLLDAAGKDSPEVAVPRDGLPRWNSGASKITINRPGTGSAR